MNYEYTQPFAIVLEIMKGCVGKELPWMRLRTDSDVSTSYEQFRDHPSWERNKGVLKLHPLAILKWFRVKPRHVVHPIADFRFILDICIVIHITRSKSTGAKARLQAAKLAQRHLSRILAA